MLGDERLIWVMDGRRPCPERVEVYSRVCGFFRPVQQWNRGKREEFRERLEYKVDRIKSEAPAPGGGWGQGLRGGGNLQG